MHGRKNIKCTRLITYAFVLLVPTILHPVSFNLSVLICNTFGSEEKGMQFWKGNMKERSTLKNLTYMRRTFKWNFKKRDERFRPTLVWLKLRVRGEDVLVSVVTRICCGKSKRNHGLIPGKGKKDPPFFWYSSNLLHIKGVLWTFLWGLQLTAYFQPVPRLTPLPQMLSWCAQGYPRPCQVED